MVIYINDILVTGSSKEEHLQALEQVLDRLQKSGLWVRKDKYIFMSPSVIYLGHKIDAEGLHPLTDKIQVIVDAPSPQNVHELKSYLGLLSYYFKFMANLATVLMPLYRLLRKDTRWRWSQKEKEVFKVSKYLLTHQKFWSITILSTNWC